MSLTDNSSDSDDESYHTNRSREEESALDEESLGSQDTQEDKGISDDKVEDLKDNNQDTATMPTPKKPAPSKKSKKTETVDDITDSLSGMSVKKSPPRQVTFYSMNWTFPFQLYSVVEGSKEILYADFLCANLPKNFVKMAKVLKGGYQLAFLMAVPKWFFEESYSKRQMGDEYDPRHARVQARSRQVIQPVRRDYNLLEIFHSGELQVINLPFQCIEGDYSPRWGSWTTKGMERVDRHKQFQKCITLKLVSVTDWLARVDEQEDVVYGNADGEDESSEEYGGMDDDGSID